MTENCEFGRKKDELIHNKLVVRIRDDSFADGSRTHAKQSQTIYLTMGSCHRAAGSTESPIEGTNAGRNIRFSS